DLDSNPTKLIEVVHIGKQMLMTRGSLTTFSIANDVAKYFAIIRAFASDNATVVIGTSLDPDMNDELRVTVVATGIGMDKRPEI
ncbi:hypothetical protein ONN26_26000, partial [Salmonella enterica subsp. enterica serovar Muenster]|nr:hypothetical protein [Salmonella enterica subsp. enterica serovar Muenster]